MTIDERVEALIQSETFLTASASARLAARGQLRKSLLEVARDQRHLCAESCLGLPNETITRTEAHQAVMNTPTP